MGLLMSVLYDAIGRVVVCVPSFLCIGRRAGCKDRRSRRLRVGRAARAARHEH
jgi:hypothetical protein